MYAWKHAECMKWPQGRAFTGADEVKRKSWHIGQLASRPFSLQVWSERETDMQALHVMQWK